MRKNFKSYKHKPHTCTKVLRKHFIVTLNIFSGTCLRCTHKVDLLFRQRVYYV